MQKLSKLTKQWSKITHHDILFVSVNIQPTGSTFYENKDGSDLVILQQTLLKVLVDNKGGYRTVW